MHALYSRLLMVLLRIDLHAQPWTQPEILQIFSDPNDMNTGRVPPKLPGLTQVNYRPLVKPQAIMLRIVHEVGAEGVSVPPRQHFARRQRVRKQLSVPWFPSFCVDQRAQVDDANKYPAPRVPSDSCTIFLYLKHFLHVVQDWYF